MISVLNQVIITQYRLNIQQSRAKTTEFKIYDKQGNYRENLLIKTPNLLLTSTPVF